MLNVEALLTSSPESVLVNNQRATVQDVRCCAPRIDTLRRKLPTTDPKAEGEPTLELLFLSEAESPIRTDCWTNILNRIPPDLLRRSSNCSRHVALSACKLCRNFLIAGSGKNSPAPGRNLCGSEAINIPLWSNRTKMDSACGRQS